jgi:hypothetical protein
MSEKYQSNPVPGVVLAPSLTRFVFLTQIFIISVTNQMYTPVSFHCRLLTKLQELSKIPFTCNIITVSLLIFITMFYLSTCTVLQNFDQWQTIWVFHFLPNSVSQLSTKLHPLPLEQKLHLLDTHMLSNHKCMLKVSLPLCLKHCVMMLMRVGVLTAPSWP